MIPRTVQMAQAVAAQLTSSELNEYGNILLNGYAAVGPNTANKKAWQYQDTATPPVDLPSVVSVQPMLRGWTTNYQEYYTKLQPNGYGVNPGDPTMFSYFVHSFSKASGPIETFGGNGTWISGGSGYTPGTYLNVPLLGGSGTGATANIVVKDLLDVSGPVASWTQTSQGAGYPSGAIISDAATRNTTGKGSGATFDGSGSFALPFGFSIFLLRDTGNDYRPGDILEVDGGTVPARVTVDTVGIRGTVTSVAIVNPGSGYVEGEALTAVIPGGGTGFYAPIGKVTAPLGSGGEYRWAQPPRRFFQNQVASFVPPNDNRRAIQYSFLYPVADNPIEPPVDTL